MTYQVLRRQLHSSEEWEVVIPDLNSEDEAWRKIMDVSDTNDNFEYTVLTQRNYKPCIDL